MNSFVWIGIFQSKKKKFAETISQADLLGPPIHWHRLSISHLKYVFHHVPNIVTFFKNT